jgi:hypothetical protein
MTAVAEVFATANLGNEANRRLASRCIGFQIHESGRYRRLAFRTILGRGVLLAQTEKRWEDK